MKLCLADDDSRDLAGRRLLFWQYDHSYHVERHIVLYCIVLYCIGVLKSDGLAAPTTVGTV